MTTDEAIANAARLLTNAEVETNHERMRCLEQLASTWLRIAEICAEREKV